MRTPITYYGGKTRMLPYIIPIVPDHRVYVEAFAGGAALFWGKRPSKVEVLNDINANVANFYRVMQEDFDGLMHEVQCTMHCEATHARAHHIIKSPDGFGNMERAWAFWTVSIMGWGSAMDFGFQWVGNKKDNWHPAIAVRNRRDQFKIYRSRLRDVTVRNVDAVKLISDMDHGDVFVYADPPYVGANQGPYAGYKSADFDNLLDVLSAMKGKFILSSYPNERLNEMAESCGWRQLSFSQRLGVVSGAGRKKTEMLTMNFVPDMNAGTLFQNHEVQ